MVITMDIYLFEKYDTTSKLKNILYQDYNIINCEIIKNRYGKKFLENNEIYFNISHTNNILSFVFDCEECGIDIEYTQKQRRVEQLANHYFTNEEKEVVLNSDNINNSFYHIWTMKESYSKMIGSGIVGYFNNIPSNYYESIKSYKILIDNELYILSISCKNIKDKEINFKIDLNKKVIVEEI